MTRRAVDWTRRVGLFAVAAAAAWWLFADTVRYWRPTATPANVIRFSYWGGTEDHRMWSELVAAFESRHANVRIRAEWHPISGYTTKIRQQMVAGDAPDVMMFQDEPFPQFAAAQFADLRPWVDSDPAIRTMLDDCWPTAVHAFEVEGRLHGVPIIGGNVLIYCNLDAFERAARVRGAPLAPPNADWTLDEFVETCRLLTFDENGDGRIDQYGLLQPHWVYYLPFIWSHGARLMDEGRTRWTLVGPEAIAAFRFYADLRHRWGVSPMPLEYAGQNSDTAFLSGRVAMCVNGPWFDAFLCGTPLRGRYAVVDIPRGPGGSATRVTWDALCLSEVCPTERRVPAWSFMRFALTSEAQSIFARYCRAIPARRSGAAAYIARSGGPHSPAASFVAAMHDARPQPITTGWSFVARAMQQHLTSVILDGDAHIAPEAAVANLAADPLLRSALEAASRTSSWPSRCSRTSCGR